MRPATGSDYPTTQQQRSTTTTTNEKMRQLSAASLDDHMTFGAVDWRPIITCCSTFVWYPPHRQCSLITVAVLTMLCCYFVYYVEVISVVSVTVRQSASQSPGNRQHRGIGDVNAHVKLLERRASASNATTNRADATLTIPPGPAAAAAATTARHPNAVNDDFDPSSDVVDPDLVRRFAAKMTDKERAVMAAMLRRLTDLLDDAGLTYYMCGGTLIGSYRHHGMVPWDDDVDIYVRWSDRDRIDALIRRHMLPAGYHVTRRQTIWKLFPVSANQSSPIPPFPWRYPFVDLCFYLENTTTVWDPETRWFPNFRFPRSVVFPLQRRPFMDMSLWAPRDVETYLAMTYGNLSKCSTHHYSHRHERGAGKVYTVDCRQLMTIHPFVFRSIEERRTDGSTASAAAAFVEELRIGKRILHTVRLSIPS